MIKIHFLLLWVLPVLAYSQFAPPAGQIGSTAIHKDSTVFINWVNNGIIQRGYIDIGDKSLGCVTQGKIENAFGRADNSTVSLGDSGVVVLEFSPPVTNGISWDFAVFENGFDDTFLELAFVEVSSDGENYFRFPAISLTDTSSQVESFGTLDATKIHNLAGKYRIDFGVPFDLDSLPDNDLLDKERVKFVRIIDVIGSINQDFGNRDSQGGIINDPFPTPFESGGFDLDAVGVIHQLGSSDVTEILSDFDFKAYPSVTRDILNLELKMEGSYILEILDKYSKVVKSEVYSNIGTVYLDVTGLACGLYFIRLQSMSEMSIKVKPFVKI